MKTRKEILLELAQKYNFKISLKPNYNRHFREIDRFELSKNKAGVQ